ncbi:hypothetical protein Syun_004022 [Stephania yunnanensis]|uniref:Uncharacterized protein n=1 Tax=Stephania yunnanensis TaxID=152371 RepID=A0AAP0Q132_9MAGN
MKTEIEKGRKRDTEQNMEREIHEEGSNSRKRWEGEESKEKITQRNREMEDTEGGRRHSREEDLSNGMRLRRGNTCLRLDREDLDVLVVADIVAAMRPKANTRECCKILSFAN